jgi:uncharacterized protein YdaU (DUF1376 family)
LHYYQFNIGDYASHTRHLSLLENLAFRLLLDEYYLKERPLNACSTSVARLIGMRDHQKEVEAVLNEFFILTDDGWVQNRADREILHYKDKQNKASKAGKASALQRTLNGCSADVQPNSKHKPITNNHKPKETPSATPDGFADFWLAYPKKIGKGAAEAAWKKNHPPKDRVLIAVRLQSQSEQWQRDGGQYIPNPATWLNQKRWEDGEQAGRSLFAGAI